MPKGVPNRKRKTAGSINKKGGRMAAFLLNRIRRIKRGSLLAKENHVPHPKGAQGEVGDENLFNEQGHSVFAVG